MKFFNLCAFCVLILFSSCAKQQVMMQAIPISSVPIGATVYVDGKSVGVTPTSVRLERNRCHQVTVVKDGYIPQCIGVTKRRDEKKLYSDAILQGVNTGLFFKDAQWGTQNAIESMQEAEETGKDSTLVPEIIYVQLVPEA